MFKHVATSKLGQEDSAIPLQHILFRTSFANFIIHCLSKSLPFFAIFVCGALQLLQEAGSSLQDANFVTEQRRRAMINMQSNS